MIDQTTVQGIETAIDHLAYEFQEAPGLLLTEDDLKCHLVAKIARLQELGVPAASADEGVLATAVHAEVPWFDNHNQLKLRPDITITDPSALSIQRAMQEGIPFPRKGAHFTGNSIVVELKFYRGRGGVGRMAISAIRKDMEKITLLIDRGQKLSPGTFFYGFVVVFSRYSSVSREVRRLAAQTHKNVKVIVRSAGLDP